MVSITRAFEIDAGHRLLKHESKCKNVHGHRYRIEVTVTARELDVVGRVLDFSEVKRRIGGWLNENWDHAFIAQHGDPIIDWLRDNGMRYYAFGEPPTAENLARHLAARCDHVGIYGLLHGTSCRLRGGVGWATANRPAGEG